MVSAPLSRSPWSPERLQQQAPLWSATEEHDACGTGFVADTHGVPSHAVLQMGLEALTNLMHRGAMDADGRTGDGAGVMLHLPRTILLRELAAQGIATPDASDLGLGMLFLPQDAAAQETAKAAMDAALVSAGCTPLAWRLVPTQPEVLGDKALRTLPSIWQVIVQRPVGADDAAYERRLYLARRRFERAVLEAGVPDCWVVSLSAQTVVYKGLMLASGLPVFYPDLVDPAYETTFCMFHQRYSTNTFPTWALAQPFRRLAHNGEINTLQGNRTWMTAREALFEADAWGADVGDLVPVVDPHGSDSASLDNVAELLHLSGRGLLHAMRMLIPEAWEQMQASQLPEAMRGFYAWHAMQMEPWDGPAGLVFADGRVVGAMLDRNGLRPARYTLTDDGLVIVSSETGVIDLGARQVVSRGRLGPGQMFAVDLAAGEVWTHERISEQLAAAQPWGAWVAQRRLALPVAANAALASELANDTDGDDAPLHLHLPQVQQIFGLSAEDRRLIVQPMATEGIEPLWSMGDDAPLAVLSQIAQPLASFFRQRFAQVTNPPIDALREALVTSLHTVLGRRGSLLRDAPDGPQLVHLTSPFLLTHELDALRNLPPSDLHLVTIDATFPTDGAPGALDAALTRIVAEAQAAVAGGAALLLLSDRAVTAERAPVPMPLAVGAVHHALIRAGTRPLASLICDTGDVWDVHQAAVLLGYGASAVHPWLALQTAAEFAGGRGLEDVTPAQCAAKYRTLLQKGLLKVMSRMGISAVASYHGAQLFEIIGVADDVVARCFSGTPSRIGGLALDGLAARSLERHASAFADGTTRLPDPGLLRFRRDGELHAHNPVTVTALQQVVGSVGGAEVPEHTHDPNQRALDYAAYVEAVRSRAPLAIRDLLTFRPTTAIPLSEVEPMEVIRQRFIVTAMSLGALSPEAYRTLATAMNRIGGRSNSGEGGEDRDWYYEAGDDTAHSRIKQVASARFGVTAEYLAQAHELEIKIAQGSKPGEGGQLPPHKVTDFIARLRMAAPGTSLISPPPHHDIYSIEDLAQLIYDLKQVNPRARVGVKLVASAGVGTIAAGVAKAYADYILISGHSGGTGASPLSSIKHVGAPWELGLAETQQVLTLNGLRSRVTLRTDGGLQTARDIIIAALLGAEEFGIGTAALVAIGCDMARQCHLNTCPTGIATQRADLRAKFRGTPENVIAFFSALANEVREQLAALGARTLDEIVGRADLLEQVRGDLPSAVGTLDLSKLLVLPPTGTPLRSRQTRNDPPEIAGIPFDVRLMPDALAALDPSEVEPLTLQREVHNRDRAIGARLAGEIAQRWGRERPDAGHLTLQLHGVAGQSLGAWCVSGMRLVLDGAASDYVGKGMSGGTIVIRQAQDVAAVSGANVLLGNTVLYGATGGELFAAGQAGERFAVRNSGATAVVEGVGDHGCEYMTGGTVVVLGRTGRNFAAGMSNGRAFVYDPQGHLPQQLNPELVLHARLKPSDPGAIDLYMLLQRHVPETGSTLAATILATWDVAVGAFWAVTPRPVVLAEDPKLAARAARLARAAARAAGTAGNAAAAQAPAATADERIAVPAD